MSVEGEPVRLGYAVFEYTNSRFIEVTFVGEGRCEYTTPSILLIDVKPLSKEKCIQDLGTLSSIKANANLKLFVSEIWIQPDGLRFTKAFSG